MLCDASALAPHCACGSASWRLTHVTQTQSVSSACAQRTAHFWAGISAQPATDPAAQREVLAALAGGRQLSAEQCVCVLHGYYPQARNPDSSRNSCWIWNSLSSTDGSTMPPHPRADGPHHSSAETSLPRKPSVPESISSGGFEPATSRCVARSSSLFNVAAYDGSTMPCVCVTWVLSTSQKP